MYTLCTHPRTATSLHANLNKSVHNTTTTTTATLWVYTQQGCCCFQTNKEKERMYTITSASPPLSQLIFLVYLVVHTTQYTAVYTSVNVHCYPSTEHLCSLCVQKHVHHFLRKVYSDPLLHTVAQSMFSTTTFTGVVVEDCTVHSDPPVAYRCSVSSEELSLGL